MAKKYIDCSKTDLKIIKIIYFDKEKEKFDTDHNILIKFSLTFSTILILLYFIFPNKIIEIVSKVNVIWWDLKYLILKK